MRSARRVLFSVLLVGSLASVPGSALAASSIEFQWVDTGTPTLTVDSAVATSVTAEAQLAVTADAAGVSAFLVSFLFDQDGFDELDIADTSFAMGSSPGGRERRAFGFSPSVAGFGLLQLESRAGSGGALGSFDLVAPGGGFQSDTRVFGSIFFTVKALNVLSDGVDIEIAVLSNNFDIILDSSGMDISDEVELVGGVVNSTAVFPEPGTGLLLGSGLLALALWDRRRR